MIWYTRLILPFVVIGAIRLNASCGRRGENGSSIAATIQENEVAPQEASAKMMDMALVVDFAQALRRTQTKLELSASDYRQFSKLIPGNIAGIIDQLIQSNGIEKVLINSNAKLLQFQLSKSEVSFDVGLEESMITGNIVSIDDIRRESDARSDAVIVVSGITYKDSKVTGLKVFDDTSLSLVVDSEKGDLRTKPLIIGSSDTSMMPTAGVLLQSLFALSNAVRIAPRGNNVQVIGKVVGEDGKPQIDQSGLVLINRDSRLRNFFREVLVEYKTDSQYLQLYDEITDVVLDQSGFKFWLRRPVVLRFSQGALHLQRYVEFRSTDMRTIIPVRGITTTAAGADGATLQSLQLRVSGSSTILDAQVYGYRKTILGKFDKQETISFPF